MEAQWLIAFFTIWFIHFVLFGMQRASLLISRNAGVEWRGSGELLLPNWYPVTWLIIIIKWGLLVAMMIFWDWKIALGLAVSSFIVSTVAPIPYSAYKSIFKKRIIQIRQQDPMVADQLQEMLDTAPF